MAIWGDANPLGTTREPDVRFCPYCGQMSFDLRDLRDRSVYCEFCGVDVLVADLVKVA